MTLSDRPALAALALSLNSSCVTAIGNDYGFDRVFSRQLEALARSGDIVIGISTSGNSLNVLHAMSTARKMGLRTIALTGRTGEAQGRCGSLYLRAIESDAAHSGMPHSHRPHHLRASGAGNLS
jgi:D-sedoheptulose 7-phosphate isomerase